MKNCIDCVYMDRDDINRYGEMYCEYLRKYTSKYGNCSNYEARDTGYSTGCYLTTAMCDILGQDDDCTTLEILRSYRDNYLKNNEEYLSLLMEYDIIGPHIARCLYSDSDRHDIAIQMLTEYINPAINMIMGYKYDEAASIYIDMTQMLKDRYCKINSRNKRKIKVQNKKMSYV